MPQLTSSRPCPTCARRTMSIKTGTSHGVHFILTLFTIGLWLPIWILAGICAMSGDWACSQCGLKV